MRTARVTLLPPTAIYRDGSVQEDATGQGGFSYTPRFLREAARRTGANHDGPTILLEVLEPGGQSRRVQLITILIGSDGSISFRQDQGVTPAFLEDPEDAKTNP